MVSRIVISIDALERLGAQQVVDGLSLHFGHDWSKECATKHTAPSAFARTDGAFVSRHGKGALEFVVLSEPASLVPTVILAADLSTQMALNLA